MYATDQMTDDIDTLVERELGERPERVTEIEEGLQHDTYRIHCDAGTYILHVAEADEEVVDALRQGLYWYVALQDSAVPVPGVVTETVRKHDGRHYVLVEKLPGETAERDIDPERVHNAGRYLAKIHGFLTFERAGWIRFDDGDPVVEAFEAGSPRRWLMERLDERVRILRGKELETVGKDVERVFDRVGEHLPDTFQPVLCHSDYSADNVLFEEGTVTGILDFDYAYAGHDHRDIVKSANGFWMHDPTANWDVRSTFYEGYREETELDRSFERNEPLYRAETHAGTVAALLDMGELSDSEQEFYAGTIRDALERISASKEFSL